MGPLALPRGASLSLSPNHGPRRDGALPELIVIHYTAMATFQAAQDRLCDPIAEVSAHYLISESGRLITLVDESRRAWHAGAGEWQGRGDVNSRSIGIELANDGTSPFPEPQMAALEHLLRGILGRWSLPPRAVIAHSDMAPRRKIDPGSRFDWRRLARQGLSVWPMPAAPGDFVADTARFGYPADALDAFRLRFRPWASGPLDDTDRALAAGLDAASATA